MPVSPTIREDQEFMTLNWLQETGTSLKGEIAMYSDITVQLVGTGTATIAGSNDGTNWVTLHDLTAATLAGVAAGTMWTLLEHPFFLRVVVAGGTMDVYALCSGNR